MIKVISILGAGTMGHGIAQVAAMANYQVYLYDIKEDFVIKGFNSIKANLDKGVEKGKVTSDARNQALENIKTTINLSEAAKASDLVIEAVPESLELKRNIFSALDGFCPSSTILATNTSSLSIKDIASATKRPQLVLGMHFFNPVHIMKLLEIVHTEETSKDTIETTLEISHNLGKEPILVKDSPGFASSRLGITLGLEAMRMLEQGVASAADIDKAMELGYNHPMGPLKLTDLVGLDVRLNIADYLFSTLGSEVFRAPEILRQKVTEGKLGKKSGEGFYKW